MRWQDHIRPNEALETKSATAISALERFCSRNDSALNTLRKSLVEGDRTSDKSAYAQLQILKDRWGKAGGAIHGLEDELLERMKVTGRIESRNP